MLSGGWNEECLALDTDEQQTVLDGGGLDTVLSISFANAVPGAQVTLRRVALTNGYGALVAAGGLYVNLKSGIVRLEEAEFSANAGSYGAALFVEEGLSQLDIFDSVFSHNDGYTSAAEVYVPNIDGQTIIVIDGSDFDEDFVWSRAGDVTFTRNTFTGGFYGTILGIESGGNTQGTIRVADNLFYKGREPRYRSDCGQ